MMHNPSKRLLLLAGKLGYQTRSFADAGRNLGVEVVLATDRCHQLEDPWADGALSVAFASPAEAAEQIVAQTRARPVHGVLALGDRPTVAGAMAARALGLPGNSPEAVQNCRSKLRQREVLGAAGLPIPTFFGFRRNADLSRILPRVKFPCVVKPWSLSASQGVIRANTPEEFAGAVWRIGALLESPEVRSTREPDLDRLLVEEYIPGREVALEGLLDGGRVRTLAIFDKPDPLEGPYFEETIYVTPTRLPAETHRAIRETALLATAALGLTHGPVHAEFRINSKGVWPLELAPRPIGGLCARALRFGPGKMSLEELLVRDALGLPGSDAEREETAAGVMMIPVPQSGVLEGVEGLDSARATQWIEDIVITARLRDAIMAWPEGSSYLGFIFARGLSNLAVEAALREAHSRLRFFISDRLRVEHPVTGRMPLVRSE